ncbi:translation initiation factor IF-3 [Finegoldia magna SY403409CC001050417]|uniref:Translation initiation factor IF-3 n=4 Tax=Finegoldia TaxID=150022 RepID=B0S173_FINM2|nr:translation initiation factor IF-3 [Finegoldia magna SY403409CC001050417]BAG08113.1 translation initiation factor IF-3 [Finegoldia magna ATCC 29328]
MIINFWRVSLPAIIFLEVNNIKDLMINEEIRSSKVRLIDDEGEQIGVIPIKEALKMAEDKHLDLVNVAPNAKPPVCKILDYGKYKYDALKKEKEAKKNQKVINVKEIRLSPNIEKHDLEVKANQASKFLSNENRVKVSVRFRGRELGHKDLGKEVLDKFYELTKDVGQIEKKPSMEGRMMIMFMGPLTDKDN